MRVSTGWLSPQDDSGQHLNMFVDCHICTYCQISKDSVLKKASNAARSFLLKSGVWGWGGAGGGLRCLNDAHNDWQAIRTEQATYSQFHNSARSLVTTISTTLRLVTDR